MHDIPLWFCEVALFLKSYHFVNRCIDVQRGCLFFNLAIFTFDIVTVTWSGRLIWWRHQMETFSALLAICEGNLPVTGRFPLTKASDVELALMFSLICAWTNGRANNLYAGDLRRHRAHYHITVMNKENPIANHYWPFVRIPSQRTSNAESVSMS